MLAGVYAAWIVLGYLPGRCPDRSDVEVTVSRGLSALHTDNHAGSRCCIVSTTGNLPGQSNTW